MKTARLACCHALILVTLLLAACGRGGGGDAVVVTADTESCPSWNVGDTFSYLATTAVGGASTAVTQQFVVTEHAAEYVNLSDGITTTQISIVDGRYIDENQFDLPLCSPPAVGETDSATAWVPGPVEGTGDWVTTTWLVTSVTIDTVRVPAGEFTAKRINISATSVFSGTTTPAPEPPDHTVSRYYVGGVGNVKEVTVIPATGTSIMKEMIAYHYP